MVSASSAPVEKTTWHRTTGIKAKRLAERKDLSDDDWKNIRRRGIGGSDIAALAGANPWSSPMHVYLDKVGLHEVQENEKMKWGKLLEQPVADEYARNHPLLKIQNVHAVLQHSDIPFALANIDRLQILPSSVTEKQASIDPLVSQAYGKGNGVLEIKTTGWAQAWAGAELPDMYYMQKQWYLGITGLKWGSFGTLISGQDYVEKGIIEADPELFENMLKLADTFWHKHVKTNTPPPPQGEADLEAVKILFKNRFDKKIVHIPDELDALIEKRRKLSETEKIAKSQRKEIDAHILFRMEDANYGITAKHKVTRVVKNDRRIKNSLVKERYPEVYSECSTPSQSIYIICNPLSKESK